MIGLPVCRATNAEVFMCHGERVENVVVDFIELNVEETDDFLSDVIERGLLTQSGQVRTDETVSVGRYLHDNDTAPRQLA